jgi:hypothetical protein
MAALEKQEEAEQHALEKLRAHEAKMRRSDQEADQKELQGVQAQELKNLNAIKENEEKEMARTSANQATDVADHKATVKAQEEIERT